ncbi:hypothetical protein AU255_07375 [Methyloprofundus sedimenti]|uniref:Toxin CptA n=1 Tax=Methyloprofundus sedimenti TaxID=1420851 RepID=A0A1V8M7Z9_9GAMM|nr:hypothetical protein AU255_07375 [Methyloprofundus sedimenti]
MWVEVKQSRYLLAFIIVVHVLVTLSCLLLPVTIASKMLLSFLPVCSLYFYLKRYTQGFYTFTLRHTEEFSWELVEHNDYSYLRILKSSVLTSFIIILQVEIDKKHRSLLICRDAVSAETYRQLFVALKIMTLE